MSQGTLKCGAVISGGMILESKLVWSLVAAGLRSPFRQKGPTWWFAPFRLRDFWQRQNHEEAGQSEHKSHFEREDAEVAEEAHSHTAILCSLCVLLFDTAIHHSAPASFCQSEFPGANFPVCKFPGAMHLDC